MAADPVDPVRPSPDLQAVLIHVYKTDAKNAGMCERLVDLDEGVQEWRYRHMKMVERTIGVQAGHRRFGRRRLSAHDIAAAGVPGPVGDQDEPLRDACGG